MNKFENTWLSRYPKPAYCIHDRGTEFPGSEFQMMLRKYNIRSRQSTTKNPQSNAICERMHQSMANQIRAVYYENPPDDIQKARETIDSLLSNVLYALRVGVHSVLNMSPGSIAFQRDMIMSLSFIVDLDRIQDHRQCVVDKNNDKENAKRIDYNYHVGEWILIRKDTYKTLSKLEERYLGPYQVVQVHVNGTLTIRKRTNVLERINIRRIKPYNGSPTREDP